MSQLKIDSREQFIGRFSKACAQDERILAAFLGGSLATGETDRRSDLDLFAILGSGVYDTFFAERREFVQHWANPVFLEDFNGSSPFTAALHRTWPAGTVWLIQRRWRRSSWPEKLLGLQGPQRPRANCLTTVNADLDGRVHSWFARTIR